MKREKSQAWGGGKKIKIKKKGAVKQTRKKK